MGSDNKHATSMLVMLSISCQDACPHTSMTNRARGSNRWMKEQRLHANGDERVWNASMAECEWSAGDKLMVQDWLDFKWHKAQVLDVAKEYIKVSQLPLRHALAIFVSPTSRAQPDNSKYFMIDSLLGAWLRAGRVDKHAVLSARCTRS